MIDTLHTNVTARAIGAGGYFSNTKKLVDDMRKLREELEAAVRKNITLASPKGNETVDQDVGRTLSCKFSRSDSAKMSARRLKRSVKSKM